MESIKTQKGRDMLVFDGYCFLREKIGVNGKLIWKCSEYKVSKCMARCHTVNGAVVKNIAVHNHIPDAAKIEARKVIIGVKQRAATTQESTHQIVATTSAGVTAAVAGQLPAIRGIKQTIRRARRQQQIPLPTPGYLLDLIIPDVYKTTIDGENFLSYDSGPGHNRILIFATQNNLNRMVRCPHWLFPSMEHLNHLRHSFSRSTPSMQ